MKHSEEHYIQIHQIHFYYQVYVQLPLIYMVNNFF